MLFNLLKRPQPETTSPSPASSPPPERIPTPERLDLPPLTRIETAWHKPWLVAGLLQQGDRHYEQGQPSDDAYVLGGNANAFWMVAADGVGSLPRSDIGARIATEAVSRFLAEALKHADASRLMMEAAFAAAHAELVRTAKDTGDDPINFATTLAAALIAGDTIVAGAIGDSSVTAYTAHLKDGVPSPKVIPFCSAPQYYEQGYTHDIHDAKWAAFARFNESRSPHIKAVAVATDGAKLFHLGGGPKCPGGFNPKLFDDLESSVEDMSPRGYLGILAVNLMELKADNDDDRTFLCAYRLPERLHPPAYRPKPV